MGKIELKLGNVLAIVGQTTVADKKNERLKRVKGLANGSVKVFAVGIRENVVLNNIKFYAEDVTKGPQKGRMTLYAIGSNPKAKSKDGKAYTIRTFIAFVNKSDIKLKGKAMGEKTVKTRAKSKSRSKSKKKSKSKSKSRSKSKK